MFSKELFPPRRWPFKFIDGVVTSITVEGEQGNATTEPHTGRGGSKEMAFPFKTKHKNEC